MSAGYQGDFHRGGLLRDMPPIVNPSPFATLHEWGNPYGAIKRVVGATPEEFELLTFKVLAMAGENFATWQLPSHDPPVAWHVDHLEDVLGLDVLACPGVEYGTVRVLAPGGYMDPDPLVLPAEPGRR